MPTPAAVVYPDHSPVPAFPVWTYEDLPVAPTPITDAIPPSTVAH